MASALNVSSLPQYIEEHKDELFVKSVVGAKTLEYIGIMTGVKFKDALNYINSTATLQDGSECGWNPAGSDVFTQRYIEVKPIKVEKEFCWKDFRKTYANYQTLFEAGRENLPFEQKIAESNMNEIKKSVEDLVWQGNSTLSIDGLLAQAAADAAVVDVTFTSGQTIDAKVDAMVAAVPQGALQKGVHLFMSFSDFRNYVVALNSACCANRPIIDAASDTILYSGDSRIRIVPVLGLEGTNKMVAAPADALVYGTDIEGSEGVYRMWYDEKSDMMDFRVLFNAGTAIKFPDEVVLGA